MKTPASVRLFLVLLLATAGCSSSSAPVDAGVDADEPAEDADGAVVEDEDIQDGDAEDAGGEDAQDAGEDGGSEDAQDAGSDDEGDVDRCLGVVCDQPPRNSCQDEVTLLEYSGEGSCDPATGECEYSFEERVCSAACVYDRCQADIGDNFALLIPAGTTKCSKWSFFDLITVLDSKVRLHFKEGLWLLPKDQDSFEMDLVDRLEITPPDQISQPLGPGIFTRELEGDPDYGRYTYHYMQQYQHEGVVFELSFHPSFEVVAGQATKPVILVDDPEALQTCNPPVLPLVQSVEWGNILPTCQFDLPDLFSATRVEVGVENGDQITFRVRASFVCCCFIGHDWAELVGADFVRGQEQREVTDFFKLAFRADHHIFGQSFLAVFDSPVDTVHGVMLLEADYAQPVLHYLDAGLNIIETPAISSLDIIQE